MVYEGISKLEVINNLLGPQSSKTILTKKCQTILEKIGMYYTNCHKKNHNVENYIFKRKEDVVLAIYDITTQ